MSLYQPSTNDKSALQARRPNSRRYSLPTRHSAFLTFPFRRRLSNPEHVDDETEKMLPKEILHPEFPDQALEAVREELEKISIKGREPWIIDGRTVSTAVAPGTSKALMFPMLSQGRARGIMPKEWRSLNLGPPVPLHKDKTDGWLDRFLGTEKRDRAFAMVNAEQTDEEDDVEDDSENYLDHRAMLERRRGPKAA